MRRAVPVLAATGGVLALLANFHTSPAPSGVADTASGPDEATTSTLAPSTATTRELSPGTTAPRTTTTTTTTTTNPNAGNTVDGPIAANKWGDVQVRVTFSGRRIIDVQALKMPNSNSHSAALSRESQPILRQEALQAQSSAIDIVSGATLTSDSYIVSLQGALDRAGR